MDWTGRGREGELTWQSRVQVDYPDARLADGIEKVLAKDVHPPGQDDEIRTLVTFENLLGEGGVVLVAGLLDAFGVLVRLGLEAVGDEVEVLPGDVAVVSSCRGVCLAPVHDELDDGRVGDAPVGHGVDEGLKVGAIATGHDQDSTCGSHDEDAGEARQGWCGEARRGGE